MLKRFESPSKRVRGLTFHSIKPWILSSLESGEIQLWDYYTRTLIHTYNEHKGDVRGVHFHSSMPYFVSGGDDCKIKVWDYSTHRCRVTLVKHTNFVRTVQFHHQYPWIVSASDDTTIRIWDWKLETCLSVLSGHTAFVMCASFHPKDNLVVSASMDSTVRVWDIGYNHHGGVYFKVKHVFRGHTEAVNWASFHPTLPLIVSGADDSQVKLWHTDGTEDLEADTLRGHRRSVSSVIFHAKQDIIVSNSEDKSIRVWDATKRTVIQTFQEPNRFKSLAVHPESNLLAAGHDKGMIVFKLERERPPFSLSGDSLFYTKDGFLRYYQYPTKKDSQVIPIRCPDTRSLNQSPRTLSYSPTDNAVLICSDLDGGSYELVIIPKDNVGRSDTVQDAKRGKGHSAVFIAPTLFAVLEKSTKHVLIKNIKDEELRKIYLPLAAVAICYAGAEKLLCSSKDVVFIFDLQQGRVLAQLKELCVRYVVWSKDMKSVALLSKDTVTIASKELVVQCKLEETIRVKSGAWDNNSVFIYTTLTHIKFWSSNGERGIIQTLVAPVYITQVSEKKIFYLDRVGKNRAIAFEIKKKSGAAARKRQRIDDGAAASKKPRIDDGLNHAKNNAWMDLENVSVPNGFPADQVYGRIEKRLKEKGFHGPLEVTAVVSYQDSVVPAGLRNNIAVDIVSDIKRPQNSKNDQTADEGIKDRVEAWLQENHPPQNVILFTGDNWFSNLMKKLRAAGHTTMVVLRKIEGQIHFSSEIKAAVDICWDDWTSFLDVEESKVQKQIEAAKMAKEEKKMKAAMDRDAKYEKRRRKNANKKANKKKNRESK